MTSVPSSSSMKVRQAAPCKCQLQECASIDSEARIIGQRQKLVVANSLLFLCSHAYSLVFHFQPDGYRDRGKEALPQGPQKVRPSKDQHPDLSLYLVLVDHLVILWIDGISCRMSTKLGLGI